jgi:hypothetical protein
MRLERAINAAGCSLLFPGLGQLLQERHAVGVWHCLEVVSLLLVGVIDESHRPFWIGLAVAINGLSIIDAFFWESRRFQAPAT